MDKYCAYCGKELDKDSIFCQSCGKKIDKTPAQPKKQPTQKTKKPIVEEKQKQPAPPPVTPKPAQVSTKPVPVVVRPAPVQSKKMDKKLIGILLGIIITIVVVIIIVVVLFQTGVIGGPEVTDVIGLWESDSLYLRFTDEHAVELSDYDPYDAVEMGTWSLEGNTLTITITGSEQYNYLTGSFTCELKNDKQTLVLKANNKAVLTLYKLDDYNF